MLTKCIEFRCHFCYVDVSFDMFGIEIGRNSDGRFDNLTLNSPKKLERKFEILVEPSTTTTWRSRTSTSKYVIWSWCLSDTRSNCVTSNVNRQFNIVKLNFSYVLDFSTPLCQSDGMMAREGKRAFSLLTYVCKYFFAPSYNAFAALIGVKIVHLINFDAFSQLSNVTSHRHFMLNSWEELQIEHIATLLTSGWSQMFLRSTQNFQWKTFDKIFILKIRIRWKKKLLFDSFLSCHFHLQNHSSPLLCADVSKQRLVNGRSLCDIVVMWQRSETSIMRCFH